MNAAEGSMKSRFKTKVKTIQWKRTNLLKIEDLGIT